MFMQSLHSVSMFFFWSHKGSLWEKLIREAEFSISIEIRKVTKTVN